MYHIALPARGPSVSRMDGVSEKPERASVGVAGWGRGWVVWIRVDSAWGVVVFVGVRDGNEEVGQGGTDEVNNISQDSMTTMGERTGRADEIGGISFRRIHLAAINRCQESTTDRLGAEAGRILGGSAPQGPCSGEQAPSGSEDARQSQGMRPCTGVRSMPKRTRSSRCRSMSINATAGSPTSRTSLPPSVMGEPRAPGAKEWPSPTPRGTAGSLVRKARPSAGSLPTRPKLQSPGGLVTIHPLTHLTMLSRIALRRAAPRLALARTKYTGAGNDIQVSRAGALGERERIGAGAGAGEQGVKTGRAAWRRR